MGTEDDSVAFIANLQQVKNVALWPSAMLIRGKESGCQVKSWIIDHFPRSQMASVVGSRVGIHKSVARFAKLRWVKGPDRDVVAYILCNVRKRKG